MNVGNKLIRFIKKGYWTLQEMPLRVVAQGFTADESVIIDDLTLLGLLSPEFKVRLWGPLYQQGATKSVW